MGTAGATRQMSPSEGDGVSIGAPDSLSLFPRTKAADERGRERQTDRQTLFTVCSDRTNDENDNDVIVCKSHSSACF